MTIEFTPDGAPEQAEVPFSAEAEIGHLAERIGFALMALSETLCEVAVELWDDYGFISEDEGE